MQYSCLTMKLCARPCARVLEHYFSPILRRNPYSKRCAEAIYFFSLSKHWYSGNARTQNEILCMYIDCIRNDMSRHQRTNAPSVERALPCLCINNSECDRTTPTTDSAHAPKTLNQQIARVRSRGGYSARASMLLCTAFTHKTVLRVCCRVCAFLCFSECVCVSVCSCVWHHFANHIARRNICPLENITNRLRVDVNLPI